MAAPQGEGTPAAGAGATARALASAAANRGKSIASIWEHSAVLTNSQQAAVGIIAASCAQRPLPRRLAAGGVPATPDTAPAPPTPLSPGSTDGTESSFAGTSFEDVTLQNSSDFYRWLSELEAARSSETEEKFRRYGAALERHLAACDGLLASVKEVLDLFERLKEQHRAVATRTSALHSTCERLVAERSRLEELAGAIRAKLAYFDELEAVAAQFHTAAGSVDSADFLPLLRRLDDCIAYVAANPQFADAASYAVKFRQLQARALTAVRTKVQGVLRGAAAAVARERGGGGANGKGGVAAAGGVGSKAPGEAATDSAEAALLYVRFRAAAEPALKGLLQGIEQRAQQSQDYARLLKDCQNLYCETRLGLMQAHVAAHVRQCAAQPLPSLLRSGCAYLMQACAQEGQLFEQFFPATASAGGGAALAPLVDPLCTLLYDAVRPALIGVQDIDALCELVDILKLEVMEEALGRRGDAAAPLEPMLQRTLADIQERLTYRAQAFIREDIAGFAPKPADLDYPRLLEEAAAAAAAAAAAPDASGGGDGEQQPASASGEGGDEALPVSTPAAAATPGAGGGQPAAAAPAAPELYRSWYPPVQRTLLLLSKLYRGVDARIFNGLAHEAVLAATTSVQDAARQILKARGVMDSQLFAIKQLLALREQIAPFKADFAVVERDLDFTHMRDYLRRTLSGQLPLFSLSSDNAFVQLMGKGGPRLQESQVDSKKELERALKSTCEAFIMHATKLSVEPLLSFITKVTAARVAAQAAGPQGAKALREQAFAAPERVAELVGRVREALGGALPAAAAKMRLYLPSPATRAILLKPIKSNVAEAHGQIAALVEGEYTADEAAAIGLTPPAELAAALDALA
ncbi:conserved oligomeric Golgi complex subunit 3 [Micractinium conductrix]|uniref:Conserved oligomeric Golgi complex subunit 3 n=1 Tax=Micractinium conductrix TaxID=554055 RepID=A0A2P6V8B8_9CHLO|nr:conserved oligomeric Golgi complex subunit 3 [Micractinium conductrix]|eukprot:PSC70334.1 conserved oligomeric Golgi complex subunit 3 [Micractinium conductrix]